MRNRLLDGRWLLVAAVVAVGLNLRGPIVAVAPVLNEIRHDLQISSTLAGLLTSVPVLCFALASPLVAVIARRTGVNAAIALSLIALCAAVALRPWTGYGVLLIGTVVMGAAIAVGNVLLPVIIRRDFPVRTGAVLSASTTSLLVSATIPALITAPLASLVGWRAALAVWAAPAVVALLVWLGATKRTAREPADSPTVNQDTVIATSSSPGRPVWRALPAWELGVFFGLQSLLFYAATAWLPTMLKEHGGLDDAAAGTALSLFQLFGIAGAVIVPALLKWHATRYTAAALLGFGWIVFLTGLLWAPAAWAAWCILGGVTQGGCLAMGISLIAMRSTSTDAARRVSAMVQTVGYCLGATGPVVVGGITAAVAGWTAPFSLLIGLAVILGVLGVRAASVRAIS